jgi:hypothetical protein
MQLMQALPTDAFEIALTTCLAECKSALDGHMQVYERQQHDGHASTATVSFDEETSISATARTVLEWCVQTLDVLTTSGLPRQHWKDKHARCADMLYRHVQRIYENNIIAQRPGYDVVQYGLDLVALLQAMYTVLAERTDPITRAEAYRKYMAMPHRVTTPDTGQQQNIKTFGGIVDVRRLRAV